MRTIDEFFRRGGIALLVVVISAIGLAKSASYYGTLLRGFDGQFSYAAARSMAVSGDLDVTDDLPLSPWQGPFRTEFGVPTRPDGGIMNIFPVGLSLVEAVLLIPAVALSAVFGFGGSPAGYTPFEIGWVAAGLLLIAAAGLQITYSFARTLIAPPLAAAVTLAGWMGTPLLYYTAWFPFSAHPTTFCIMVLLLLVADRLPHTQWPNTALLAFGGLAALLYLTRPHQSLYVVLLAVWRIPPLLRKGGKAWLPGAILGLAVCVAAIGFQAAVHQRNIGTLALIAHGHHNHPMISGHFDLKHPHFDVVLFSPARGLFWITPIVLLSLVGYACQWRTVPWWGLASLINAGLQTSILSFWSDPGQGDSFGIRLWAEHVPVVVCGLALLIRAAEGRGRLLRASVALAACACVAWTLLLCACYIFGTLQPGMSYQDVVSWIARKISGSR